MKGYKNTSETCNNGFVVGFFFFIFYKDISKPNQLFSVLLYSQCFVHVLLDTICLLYDCIPQFCTARDHFSFDIFLILSRTQKSH